MHYHRQRHETQHDGLEPGVLAQQDRDIADEGHVAHHATDDVLRAIEVALAASVQFGVVGCVVVALGEELEWCFSVPIVSL